MWNVRGNLQEYSLWSRPCCTSDGFPTCTERCCHGRCGRERRRFASLPVFDGPAPAHPARRFPHPSPERGRAERVSLAAVQGLLNRRRRSHGSGPAGARPSLRRPRRLACERSSLVPRHSLDPRAVSPPRFSCASRSPRGVAHVTHVVGTGDAVVGSCGSRRKRA